MLKKTITYDDYNGNTVAEDFYFNFTKLEAAEMLEVDDLDGTIDRLTKTQDAKEAYNLFKDIVLKAYGEKSIDGKRFHKSAELRKNFEDSPALGEMIFEFLNDPKLGAQFIEATLPARMVAEAKKAQAEKPSSQDIENMVQDAANRQANPETAVLPTAPPVLEHAEPTDEELLKMNPKEMTQEQLLRAFQLKSQQ